MFSPDRSQTSSSANGADVRDVDERLLVEERYHARVRQLNSQTAKLISSLQQAQVHGQQQAVVSMTRALERLVTTTAEMVGFWVGSLVSGGKAAGQNMLANFLDLLGQFSVMMGTMAVAASKVLEALFTGNPIGLFVGGLAMIAVGGLIKAFASQLKSQGGALGSGSGLMGATPLGGGAASGSNSLTPLVSASSEGGGQVVYYYHFEGGLYDERGLARLTAKALNTYSGRTAPKISRLAIEGV
jgi:hypothetical protein